MSDGNSRVRQPGQVLWLTLGAGLLSLVIAGLAGWFGRLVFLAGYVVTWLPSMTYGHFAGRPTRRTGPVLAAMLIVLVPLAWLATLFGLTVRDLPGDSLGEQVAAYFAALAALANDPSRASRQLLLVTVGFALFGLLGAVPLIRAAWRLALPVTGPGNE